MMNLTKNIEEQAPKTPNQNDELRDFMIVVRSALLMVASYIEQRYVKKKPNSK